jgi:hypothetical protein
MQDNKVSVKDLQAIEELDSGRFALSDLIDLANCDSDDDEDLFDMEMDDEIIEDDFEML